MHSFTYIDTQRDWAILMKKALVSFGYPTVVPAFVSSRGICMTT